MKPLLVAICGGSCSGKTTSAKLLKEHFGEEVCTILYQDNYYRDQSSKFDFDGGSVNFDHPDAIDFPLMRETILELKEGKISKIPQYDFATHSRSDEWLPFEPKKIILVDGILILHSPELKDLFDLKVYFCAGTGERLERRVKRDVKERGRTPEGVKKQFDVQVEPMHQEFVGPSKASADLIYQHEDEQVHQDFISHIIAKCQELGNI
jgi:uridine kinase